MKFRDLLEDDSARDVVNTTHEILSDHMAHAAHGDGKSQYYNSDGPALKHDALKRDLAGIGWKTGQPPSTIVFQEEESSSGPVASSSSTAKPSGDRRHPCRFSSSS